MSQALVRGLKNELVYTPPEGVLERPFCMCSCRKPFLVRLCRIRNGSKTKVRYIYSKENLFLNVKTYTSRLNAGSSKDRRGHCCERQTSRGVCGLEDGDLHPEKRSVNPFGVFEFERDLFFSQSLWKIIAFLPLERDALDSRLFANYLGAKVGSLSLSFFFIFIPFFVFNPFSCTLKNNNFHSHPLLFTSPTQTCQQKELPLCSEASANPSPSTESTLFPNPTQNSSASSFSSLARSNLLTSAPP